MRAMKARVTSGRLRLDLPSELAEGTEVEVVLADDVESMPDGLTDKERDLLEAAHDEAIADLRAGRSIGLAEFVSRLRKEP